VLKRQKQGHTFSSNCDGGGGGGESDPQKNVIKKGEEGKSGSLKRTKKKVLRLREKVQCVALLGGSHCANKGKGKGKKQCACVEIRGSRKNTRKKTIADKVRRNCCETRKRKKKGEKKKNTPDVTKRRGRTGKKCGVLL